MIFIAVKDRAAVDEARVDNAVFADLIRACKESTSIFVFAPTPDGAYSRMFAPQFGIVEDPATGSATGPLAVFMMKYGLVSRRRRYALRQRARRQDGTAQSALRFYSRRARRARN